MASRAQLAPHLGGDVCGGITQRLADGLSARVGR